jgi:7-carboxy-7-deazaguanine synthase
MDDKNKEGNIQKTINFCRTHPLWRLSLQTHKFLGIP